MADNLTTTPGDRTFEYHGCQFRLSVVPAAVDAFMPHVLYEHGLAGVGQLALPLDTDSYASAAEAWRHAEQQAVRWVHDRTGDGQGRF